MLKTDEPLFDERNGAVRRACAELIETAHRYGCKVGICGQAPSDYPEFATFLVEAGIDSISLLPDAMLRTMADVLAIEELTEMTGYRRKINIRILMVFCGSCRP